MEKQKIKNIIATTTAVCALVAGGATLSGCGSNQPSSSSAANDNISASSEPAAPPTESEKEKASDIDYKALVNKQHALPEGWEDKLVTVSIKNSQGDDVEIEKSAYEAYLELKDELAEDGVKVDLDSARRSVADQQRIWDEFMEEKGEEYTKSHVAVPGFSEHQTGLALDLYLVVDGKDVVENDDLMKYPELWAKVHAKLAKHGFILRYQDGKDDITGYAYEPWHIRYIGDEKIAQEIMDKGISFEEYLGVADEARAAIAKEKAEAEEAERIAAEEAAAAAAAAAAAEAEQVSYDYDDSYYGGGYSYGGGDGIYHAEYNEMYNDDGPSHTMPGWHDGYLETYYNASGHYLASEWTLDDEGFYHDENGRYVVGVDVSHMDEMPYGTVVETGKGEGDVYDYGSGAEVHDFATNW